MGLITLLVNGAIVVLIPPDPQSYFAAMIDKEHRLADTPAPRLLLAGGSNLAFGVDSSLLESATGLTVVNLGLHANLGLRLMLRQAELGVQPGDQVLLIPEYQHFTGSPLDGNPKELAAVFEFDRALTRLFTNPKQYWNLVRGLPQLEPGKLVWLQRALGQGPDIVYRRDAFNAQGDVISHLDKGSGNGGLQPLFPTGEQIDLVSAAFDLVAAAAVSIEARGGRTLISYPAVSTTAYGESAPIIVKIRMKLEAIPSVLVLGTPEDYLLEPDRFFDSSYHLTRQGREERTLRLVEKLRIVDIVRGPVGCRPTLSRCRHSSRSWVVKDNNGHRDG